MRPHGARACLRLSSWSISLYRHKLVPLFMRNGRIIRSGHLTSTPAIATQVKVNADGTMPSHARNGANAAPIASEARWRRLGGSSTRRCPEKPCEGRSGTSRSRSTSRISFWRAPTASCRRHSTWFRCPVIRTNFTGCSRKCCQSTLDACNDGHIHSTLNEAMRLRVAI